MSASWLRCALAAAMAAVVVYHLARLAGLDRIVGFPSTAMRRHGGRSGRSGRSPADIDVTAVAMGVVMVVMLLGTLTPVDSRRLALLFAAPTLWFVCRGVHSYVMDGPSALGSPARQVVGCAAMVYLLVAVTGEVGPGMARMSMAGTSMAGISMAGTGAASPAITTLLTLATLTVAGWTLARVRRQPRVAGHDLAPAVTAGCQVAMNVTTAYMLMAR